LHRAVHVHPEVVSLLLARGADVEATDEVRRREMEGIMIHFLLEGGQKWLKFD